MLVDIVKNKGAAFRDLQMVCLGGQSFTDVFRFEILEYLNAVPLVGCTAAILHFSRIFPELLPRECITISRAFMVKQNV